MANIAAIKIEQHGAVNNERLKLKNICSFCWRKSSSKKARKQLFTD